MSTFPARVLSRDQSSFDGTQLEHEVICDVPDLMYFTTNSSGEYDCVFIKLHLTAHSGPRPAILVILCHSY